MPRKSTFRQVRDGLINTLKLLTVANGYSMDFPADKIYSRYNPTLASDTSEPSYPKMFVLAESGTTQKGIAMNAQLGLTFVVAVFLHKGSDTDEAFQKKIEDLITDVEELLLDQDTLGGVVNESDLIAFDTDGGVSDPEAIAVFTIETKRFRN